MNDNFTEDLLFRLTNSCKSSALYAYVAEAVTKHFKSMHYLSSTLICDCVLANLAFNEQITPQSADEIITCFRRKHKSLYTTVAEVYKYIADDFDDYAQSILCADYNSVRAINMPTANYIVYVISVDIKSNRKFDRREPFINAFGYEYFFDDVT